ncbi:SpoIIE family protein phosphatase [candidate division KSB1 bacterium]|nr:SpoIIE family protein phosphatase [candidate division KSB1 bacterium]
MTLRTKLILAILLEIALTITFVGLYAYQGSKNEIQHLARDLLIARTEYAYAKCESYNLHYGKPTPELKKAINSVRIATDGYTVAIDNNPGPAKGVVVIHPSNVGMNLNTERFPHIQAIIKHIDAQGQPDRYSAFTEYRQETGARGRQGELKIAYYMYYKPWNWILLSSAYEADLFQGSDIVLRRIVEAIAVMTIVGIIFMTLSVRRILAPLRQLTLTTQEVANGNLDATFQFESKDEIGNLAHSLNKMLLALQHNLRITQEFEIARRMQTEMLPREAPHLQGLQIVARSMPATEVGGDFYDFIRLDEQRLVVIVGDVSGKGVSGAMVMSAALSALRHAAEERRPPGEILTLANRRLARDLQRNMFVATFCAVLDTESGTLTYANAGQTLPLICRNDEAFYLPSPSHGERFPLGIRPGASYGQHQIALRPGDLLVFFTDGIVDMMNQAAEPYSFDRLLDSVKQRAHAPLGEMIEHLLEDAENFAATKERFDDITLLLTRFEGDHHFKPAAQYAATPPHDFSALESAGELRLTIPTRHGYEKIAMNTAATLAELAGFPRERVEDLRTAVAEACLNAMEHGNRMNANDRVDVSFKAEPEGLTIQIFDRGSGFAPAQCTPDLPKKIRGEESARGLGLFLIEHLVDAVEYKKLPELGHVTTLRISKAAVLNSPLEGDVAQASLAK